MKLGVLKKFIPQFIWEKIEKNPELQKIIANINWLFLDKAVQMLVALFVGVWVIRYLGPEKYGILSYAVAFVALFGVVASLGMESIAIREFVKKPKKKERILGTLFVLKFFAGIVAFILSLVTVFFVKSGDTLIFWLTSIIALGFIFQVSDVFDFWFQSQVKSKYSAYVRSGVNIATGLLKIILILMGASLTAFAWALFFISAATFFGMVTAFFFVNRKLPKIKIDWCIAKEVLHDSWPLILSGIAVTIYMKIDQIMIGNMLDNKLLGNYSAVVNLSEIWYFIPVVISGSVFPAILYAKKRSGGLYLKRLQILYDFMVWSSILFAIPISIFSKSIVNFLYGAQYSLAAPVLVVYVWAGVSVSIGVASSKFLIAENLTRITFYKSIIGAVANIILNLMLIPIFGIIGSAVATLISYFISNFAVVLFKESRIVAKMLFYAFWPFKLFTRNYYRGIFIEKD